MKRKQRKPAKRRAPEWELRLYIANTTARSLLATENLKRLCEEDLQGRCRFSVVDLAREPGLARADEILAIPTLVRVAPAPRRTVVGSLSDRGRVLRALDLMVDQSEQWRGLLARAGPQVGNA